VSEAGGLVGPRPAATWNTSDFAQSVTTEGSTVVSIEVSGITKSYGGREVVSDLSFRRDGPSVTGLLGANGSGKSTTLRMVLGLTRPDRGTALVNGGAYADLANPGATVGSMLDAQANHRGRTGREILRISALVTGVDPKRVGECLELVGLGPAGGKRFGTYSLGMKQRLGIAQALLTRPQILIFDEPANGLDPEGIWWMRDLLKSFVAGGGMVLLSSHLLREVEMIADSVVMIDGGRKIADAPMSELVSHSLVRVAAAEPGRLEDALTAAGIAFTADVTRQFVDAATTVDAVGRLALAERLVLHELRPSPQETLESAFFKLTQNEESPHAVA
jgi:ABC-2 type transport system ATP-binding protein